MTQHTPDKPSGLTTPAAEGGAPISNPADDGPSVGFIPPVDLSRNAAVEADRADLEAIAGDIDNLLARSTYGAPKAPVKRSRPLNSFHRTAPAQPAPRVIPSICDAHVTFIHTEHCLQCGRSTERITFAGVRRTMANGARAYVAMTPELSKLASQLPQFARHERSTVPHCPACIVQVAEEPPTVAPDEFMYTSKCEPLDDLRAFFSPSRQAASEQMKREAEPRQTED